MKVKELIAKLEKLDRELPVMSIDLNLLDDAYLSDYEDEAEIEHPFVALEFSEGE